MSLMRPIDSLFGLRQRMKVDIEGNIHNDLLLIHEVRFFMIRTFSFPFSRIEPVSYEMNNIMEDCERTLDDGKA